MKTFEVVLFFTFFLLISFSSLLGRLSAEDKEVFLRSGVQFSSYLPDVLRFLLPHLFLSVIASVPEDDEHTPTAVGMC